MNKKKKNNTKENNNKSTLINQKENSAFPPIDKNKLNRTNNSIKRSNKKHYTSNTINFLPNINQTQNITKNYQSNLDFIKIKKMVKI